MPNDIKIAVAAALFAAAAVLLVWKPKPLAERIPFLERIPNLKEIRRDILEDTRRTAGFVQVLQRIARETLSPRMPPLPRLFRDQPELPRKLPSADERAAMLRELADPCDKCGSIDCVAYRCQDPLAGRIVEVAEPIRLLTGIWDDYQPDMGAVTRIQSAYAELEASVPGYSD